MDDHAAVESENEGDDGGGPQLIAAVSADEPEVDGEQAGGAEPPPAEDGVASMGDLRRRVHFIDVTR